MPHYLTRQSSKAQRYLQRHLTRATRQHHARPARTISAAPCRNLTSRRISLAYLSVAIRRWRACQISWGGNLATLYLRQSVLRL